MPITAAQTAAAKEIISSILAATAPKGKRQLAGMFLQLVDRNDWPEYYSLIPEPRCLDNIKTAVEKGRYKDATDIYTDLALVFWNALYYNEEHSQISADARALKILLDSEWKKRTVLPIVRHSPPPSSAQKVNGAGGEEEEEEEEEEEQPSPSTRRRSTRGSTTTPGKSVATRSKNPAQATAHDMDVDILTSETPSASSLAPATTISAVVDTRGDRDAESDKIVEQLERGLPRWKGFGEEGWSEEYDANRMIELVEALRIYRDSAHVRLAETSLEMIPEEAFNPYLSYPHKLTLRTIEAQAKSKSFRKTKDFEIAMARLFEKARRWYQIGTESYGQVLTLQRLYQAILSATPPIGPPYVSPTGFSTLRAGPGSVKPVHGSDGEGITGVTTHRVLTKDRAFVDAIYYKGWMVKLADWVHLANPDDPSRPIIGQVFRCWVGTGEDNNGQEGLTVSWYYRPEQTFHSSAREFWDGEIFKTSHFADHPIEDLIEKVACQFTARHIRGRPRPPFWYLGFPLYVCDSRYNDRDRVFVKIKNWNSCVPEEVRKSDEFMPIYPFEKTVFPVRRPSPFLTGGPGGAKVKGPGGLIAGSDTLPSAQEKFEKQATAEEESQPISGRRTSRRLENQAKNTAATASASISAAPTATATTAAPAVAAPAAAQPIVAAATLPPPPPPVPQAAGNYYQTAQYQGSPALPAVAVRPPGPDRSVLTAAGGMVALGPGAVVEKLPAETAQYFDRDPETNQVLWFGAPPVDVARPVKPKYSLAYLEFLARKRKMEEGAVDVDSDQDNSDVEAKRRRVSTFVPPTITECIRKVLAQAEQPTLSS